MNYSLHAYAIQDIGQRSNQEDCFYPPFIDPCHYDATDREWSFYDGTPNTDDRLFLVCDGMGGHDRGEVASQTVTRVMSSAIIRSASMEGEFSDQMVHHAVKEALEALAAQDDPKEVKKMGTTMALLKFHAQGVTVAHIGDSRVYHFRPATESEPAKLLFRTQDHTYVNEMVARGQITYAQALHSPKKHILSRSMMSFQDHDPEAEINHITDIKAGDVFLLCTDGVFENMDDNALLSLLTDPNCNDVQRIQFLLQQCLENKDNHTAIFVRVQSILNAEDNKEKGNALQTGSVLRSERYTYHIEKVLGQGAFGITYLVNTSFSMQGGLGTIHTGARLALKEFCMEKEMKRVGSDLVEISPNSKAREYADKFRKEATKLASLSHPNIVKVLEVFEANNTYYYSMEYLPDGSLNDYVNSKRGLPEKEALGYIRQIGSALLYMHVNKLLHLDVKPANIMRSESSNTIKLIDFGMAKRYEDNGDPETGANIGFGTPGYAPLEQIDVNIEHSFSPQLDVYALGATYYKLLTAITPRNAADVLNSGLNTMPLVKKNVSQQSIDAIKAAMQPMKANRLQTVQEFLDMLPRVDDETVFPKQSGKRPWFWAAAVAVIVIGVCGWFYLQHNDEELTEKKDNEIAAVNEPLEIQMVTVKGGTFLMGSDDKDADADERPVHSVKVADYAIGKYEVTQALWNAVMDGTRIKKSKNGNLPVANATWDEVQIFIERLNSRTGRHFRLPTEAEWEYAARGGKNSHEVYSGASVPEDVAWYAGNSGDRLKPVGTLKPNALGLYDMSGNVWEYCSDWYGNYPAEAVTDPKGAPSGDYHVIRGGSWNSISHFCRISQRQDDSLQTTSPAIGLRLAEDV